MQHDVLGAQLQGALHFAAKGGGRFLQEMRGLAGQIDQIVGVDREWLQIVLLAQLVHDCALVTAEIVGLPLTRAGGENLKSVASQAVSALSGIFYAACNRGMYADAPGSQARRAFRRSRLQDVLLL